MGSRLVDVGNFSFKYRGYLLPIAIVLLFIPSPKLFAEAGVAGIVGFGVALLGQVARITTIGLAYIIRGGKNHQVYAEQLVTTGLYSHCRNPMYVGNFLLLVGLALASNSWVFALAGGALSLGMHKAIVAAEESFLRSRFGAQFDAYCSHVSRWVPRWSGLLTTVRGMQFDWRRVVKKEYAAGFDYFSATALLILVKLWMANDLDDYQLLTALMVLVIAARVVLWFAARQMNKVTPAEPAGA